MLIRETTIRYLIRESFLRKRIKSHIETLKLLFESLDFDTGKDEIIDIIRKGDVNKLRGEDLELINSILSDPSKLKQLHLHIGSKDIESFEQDAGKISGSGGFFPGARAGIDSGFTSELFKVNLISPNLSRWNTDILPKVLEKISNAIAMKTGNIYAQGDFIIKPYKLSNRLELVLKLLLGFGPTQKCPTDIKNHSTQIGSFWGTGFFNSKKFRSNFNNWPYSENDLKQERDFPGDMLNMTKRQWKFLVHKPALEKLSASLIEEFNISKDTSDSDILNAVTQKKCSVKSMQLLINVLYSFCVMHVLTFDIVEKFQETSGNIRSSASRRIGASLGSGASSKKLPRKRKDFYRATMFKKLKKDWFAVHYPGAFTMKGRGPKANHLTDRSEFIKATANKRSSGKIIDNDTEMAAVPYPRSILNGGGKLNDSLGKGGQQIGIILNSTITAIYGRDVHSDTFAYARQDLQKRGMGGFRGKGESDFTRYAGGESLVGQRDAISSDFKSADSQFAGIDHKQVSKFLEYDKSIVYDLDKLEEEILTSETYPSEGGHSGYHEAFADNWTPAGVICDWDNIDYRHWGFYLQDHVDNFIKTLDEYNIVPYNENFQVMSLDNLRQKLAAKVDPERGEKFRKAGLIKENKLREIIRSLF